MRAAAVQLTATEDTARNLADADRLVREAAAQGAQLVVLPEKWTVLGSDAAMDAGAEPLDGPALTWARGAAGGNGRALACPGVPAAVGRDDLDLRRAGVVEDEVDVDDAVAHAHAVSGQVHRAAGPQARALEQAVAVAFPHGPPALPRGADPRRPGAQHEIGRVDADVAPALEHAAAAKRRHSLGRERDVRGPIGPGSAVGHLQAHSAGAVILGID